MLDLELTKITRGVDWFDAIIWKVEDEQGNLAIQDWRDYELVCHFKTAPAATRAIQVQPQLAIKGEDSEVLQLVLDEQQTRELPAGRLYFNLLATKDGITQEVVDGKVWVSSGVSTRPADGGEAPPVIKMRAHVVVHRFRSATPEAVEVVTVFVPGEEAAETPDLVAGYLLRRGGIYG